MKRGVRPGGALRPALPVAGICLVVASLLAGCSSTGHPRATPATTSPRGVAGNAPAAVDWVPCKGGAGPSGYQCATVQVPRDPLNPADGTIGMALDRRPASGARIGSLLIDPGGPGASGVDFLPTAVSMMPASLLDRFDVVGFDPPGVGRTAPVTCLDAPGLAKWFHADPAPTTQAGFEAVVEEDRTFADGCEARSGAELPYVSTVDAAMDMETIRRDLGDAKLNYLGFSYGTYLGAVYAGLYPTRIRAMVLDGAVDPTIGPVRSLEIQASALDSELRKVFASCTSDSSCPWKPGPDPEAAYLSLMARVRRSPLHVPGTSRTVGPSELLYATGFTLYSTSSWGDLETALAQAERGDGADLLKLFDEYTGRQTNGTYTNEFEANTAVNCLDAPSPSVSQIEADAPAARADAPVFGVADLYSELNCAVWPVAATGHPAPVHAAGSPPILVVGSTGDPITPYHQAVSLASQLDHGVLLTRVGYGHPAYPYSSCIRSKVNSYLIDLTVPAAGTRCRSN